MAIERQAIDELVRRIVELVHPLRIILFGSAARGEAGPGSDVDLLIVVRNGTNRRRVEETLCRRLHGNGFAFDVLVSTEAMLERHRNNVELIYRAALREGRDVYAE